MTGSDHLVIREGLAEHARARTRAAALREAADEVHREARWQRERAVRSPKGFDTSTTVAALLKVELILSERADRIEGRR